MKALLYARILTPKPSISSLPACRSLIGAAQLNRCVTEDGLWGPTKKHQHQLDLLSEEQWKYVRKSLTRDDAVKRSNALLLICETAIVTEDIYSGVGVDEATKKSVSFEEVEKLAETEGKKLSKKAIEAERNRLIREQRCGMGMSSWYVDKDITLQWGFHVEEQNTLLKMLFEWLEGSGSVSRKSGVAGERTVVIVCGGGASAVETIITDTSTGRTIKQLCIGTVGGYCRPFDLQRKGSVPGSNGTYTYQHFVTSDGVTDDGIGGRHSAVKDRRRLVRGWSYGELDVLSEPYDAKICSKILCRYGGRGDSWRDSVHAREVKSHPDHSDTDLDLALRQGENSSSNYVARKLVGPVIGKVDVVGKGKRKSNSKTGGEPGGVEGSSVTARVLIELDSPCLTTLVAVNALTGERHVSVKRASGRIPCVFILEGLQQGRRYSCEWFGFEKGDCESSTFILHTPLDDDSDFVGMLVAGDRREEAEALGKDEESVWGLIADRVEEPWHGMDTLVHVGGQSGGKKDDAFLECLDYVRDLEERKEKAALECLAKRVAQRGGRLIRPEEPTKEAEERRKAEEAKEVEEAMRKAVGEEQDRAVDAEIKERFRAELRKDWNTPSKARVLKSVSNVMMRGGADIYTKFSRDVGGCMATPAGKRVVQLAEEVNEEYMRQLWDADGGWSEGSSHKGFFTTWRGGMIGALFIDCRECLGETAEVTMCGELENAFRQSDHPLISDSQWQFIRTVLEKDNLNCLMVICEVPFVWEGKDEAIQLGRSGTVDGVGNYIQDHWAYRHKQLVHVLQAIYDWRVAKRGRSVQLIGGNGSNCTTGFTTRITQKVFKTKNEEAAAAKEDGETNDPPERDVMQLALPPVTGRAGRFLPSRAGILGQFSYVHSPLTENVRGYGLVECTLETGDTGKEGDIISSIDARLVSLANANIHYRTEEEIAYDTRTAEDFDGTLKPNGDIYKVEERVGHPKGLYNKIPKWWYTWSSGMPATMFQDEVYLRARESEEHVETRLFVDKDGVLLSAIERAFVKFHLDDASRPPNLRTLKGIGKIDVLVRQLYKAVAWIWETELEPTDHKYNISYLKDEFVFHYLMRKCATQAGDDLKTLKGFTKFAKSMLNEAGVLRMAVLCQHHQEYLDRTRLEREGAARAAEIAKMQDAKDAWEKWLKAEEATLHRLKLDNKLDEFQLKTVEKKQKERAWEQKVEEMNARMQELEGADKMKVLEEEKRAAEEQKRKEEQDKLAAKTEQEEMNRLAEEDVEEYNKRLEAMASKQADELEKAKEGENVKRRRLARERKVERRNAKLLIDLPTRRERRKVVLQA